MFKKKRAQTTLEYAVLVVVIVAAVLAIKFYMGRGVEGKLRESVDQIGEQYSAGITTYKVSTEQTGAMETRETFGFDETGAERQGISYYKVKTPAPTTRKTDVAEKIETPAAGEGAESLFE